MGEIDIIFPSSSRPEFAAASLEALGANTDWSLVRKLVIYTDGDLMREGYVARAPIPLDVLEYNHGRHGGPVAIMLDYLERTPAAVFAKIDNDVTVPPGWLEAAAGVMDHHPELDLLGLEPPLSRTPAPWAGGKRIAAPENSPVARVIAWGANGYAPCEAIGGVGLMRSAAFQGRPRMVPHSTYGGFTNWQTENPDVRKGWIVPPLSLFLLDRLPFEPWASPSRRYIAQGHQRPWTNYGPEAAALWQWWLNRLPQY